MTEEKPSEPVFEPIPVPKRNFEVVVETIRRQIYAGTLQQGQKLPNETELGRQFNVGRSAIREALKVLELQGLLIVRRGYNGGTFVAPPDFAEETEATTLSGQLGPVSIESLMEARQAIEVRAAELAAERATDLEIADLEEMIRRMEGSVNIPARFIEADVDFHIAIAELARNPVFVFVLRAVRSLVNRDLNRLIGNQQLRQVLITQHTAIWNAIADHDCQRAGAAMGEHLAFIANRLFSEAQAHS